MNKKELDIKGAISTATNPAMAYISVPDISEAEKETITDDKLAKAIEAYKLRNEKKTKRVQMVFKPSVYNKAKAIAEEQGISFCEFVEVLINKSIGESEK